MLIDLYDYTKGGEKSQLQEQRKMGRRSLSAENLIFFSFCVILALWNWEKGGGAPEKNASERDLGEKMEQKKPSDRECFPAECEPRYL